MINCSLRDKQAKAVCTLHFTLNKMRRTMREIDFKIRLTKIFLFIIFFISPDCFALTQDEKLWFAINSQQTLSENKKWLSFIYSQFRLVNKSHPWQAGLLEGGVGYRFIDNGTVWLGYRWTGHNPYDGFYQENRLFQQLIQQKELTNSDRIISRTRLEETQRSNSSEISLRLRQRVAFELMRATFSKIFPLIYDEIFFQLKNTHYTPNKLISENRIFVGCNIYVRDKKWWEIGYINQFQMRTPERHQNTLNHIVSFTYNFS